MSDVAGALAAVRARIRSAAQACGRNPDEVTLVAVSKTKSPAAIRDAYAAGQRRFGENYAQELAAKAEALRDLPDLEWHFIGHVQTNKAKLVAAVAHFVHTVDTPALARALGGRVARAERGPLPVLLEVNVAGERQKHGARPDDLPALIGAVREQPALVLRGLMTVPPAGDGVVARRVFDELAELRHIYGGPSVLPELSMGMSQDLEVAIAAGATLVRVGTSIFGPRERDP